MSIITALDIGSAQTKGLVGDVKKDGSISIISVFKHPTFGIKKGNIVDIEEVTSLFKEIGTNLHRISKKATQNVFINFNNEHVKCRHSRGLVAVARADQEIQEDDLDKVFQASKAIKLSPNYLILHNVVKEFFIDDVGLSVNPVGMTGNRLEAETLIVEAFAPKVDFFIKTFSRVGIKISSVIFSPLAAARAILSKRQKDLGVLAIDFGAGTTSFSIYEDGKVVFAKVIPIGFEHLTTDIAVGLKTSVDIAQKLKVLYGYAVSKEVPRRETVKFSEIDPGMKGEFSKRFLGEIIEARLAEILDLINNELKSLGRVIQLPEGVIATGGGIKFPGFADLVEKELKKPVKTGFPNLCNFEITKQDHEKLLDNPEFSVVCGLALIAADEQRPTNGGAIKNFLKSLIP